jgi:hypothetical protein
MSLTVKFIAIAALIVLLIAIGPLLTIWALNTLFPALSIPYTIWTWLAALILASLPWVRVKR